MSEMDYIFRKIDEGQIDNNLKLLIADTISSYINGYKDSLGTWEKALFAQSISALSTNIGAKYQPTDLWLRLSLVALENAILPKDKRSEEYTIREEQVKDITYDILVGAINGIKEELRE